MNAADGLPGRRGHGDGAVVEWNIGVGVDDRIAQIAYGTLRSDFRQVWSHESTLAVDAVARGAGVFLVDERSRSRVARRLICTALATQLFYVGNHSPHLHVGKTESARHFAIRDSISNDQEHLAIRGAMVQLTAIKNGASTALASLAMTMATPSAKYFAAPFNFACGQLGIGL